MPTKDYEEDILNFEVVPIEKDEDNNLLKTLKEKNSKNYIGFQYPESFSYEDKNIGITYKNFARSYILQTLKGYYNKKIEGEKDFKQRIMYGNEVKIFNIEWHIPNSTVSLMLIQ